MSYCKYILTVLIYIFSFLIKPRMYPFSLINKPLYSSPKFPVSSLLLGRALPEVNLVSRAQTLGCCNSQSGSLAANGKAAYTVWIHRAKVSFTF